MPRHDTQSQWPRPTTRAEACDQFDRVLLALMRIWNDDENAPPPAQALANQTRQKLDPIYGALCGGDEEEKKELDATIVEPEWQIGETRRFTVKKNGGAGRGYYRHPD